ncbi:UDP-glucose/GDP-mannose dehydrogenase family protein [bacterium]|nr:UDP-glucose/GDP-mannose dehydrogenase family protein [candidate division CSSED10-310 bacterium]
MKIAVIGTGYVGLVSGVCFAECGHDVICVDKVKAKIDNLLKGIIPIYEPGLNELVESNMRAGRLAFENKIGPAVKESEVIFIAVGTPPKPTGEADLSYIEEVSRQVALAMDRYKVVVEKSTVPVKTGEWVKRTIRFNNKAGVEFDVASNPEFLREGSAIGDFLKPDRIVIGVESERASDLLRKCYQPIIDQSVSFDLETQKVIHQAVQDTKVPFIVTDVHSSELIKHASNSFLALKISYINAVANFCELAGADVEQVAVGMGLDSRIGTQFLHAGVGYGGSCFPKDVSAFLEISRDLGYDFKLLADVIEINTRQREIFIRKIKNALWILKDKTIGILGLSFKPNTDDMREAPAIDIIKSLQLEGAKIKAYDPEAMDVAREHFQDTITYCNDPYEVARNCDALVLVTEWDEFLNMDLERIYELLHYPIFIDGRNLFNPVDMKKIGFEYHCIGRQIPR